MQIPQIAPFVEQAIATQTPVEQAGDGGSFAVLMDGFAPPIDLPNAADGAMTQFILPPPLLPTAAVFPVLGGAAPFGEPAGVMIAAQPPDSGLLSQESDADAYSIPISAQSSAPRAMALFAAAVEFAPYADAELAATWAQTDPVATAPRLDGPHAAAGYGAEIANALPIVTKAAAPVGDLSLTTVKPGAAFQQPLPMADLPVGLDGEIPVAPPVPRESAPALQTMIETAVPAAAMPITRAIVQQAMSDSAVVVVATSDPKNRADVGAPATPKPIAEPVARLDRALKPAEPQQRAPAVDQVEPTAAVDDIAPQSHHVSHSQPNAPVAAPAQSVAQQITQAVQNILQSMPNPSGEKIELRLSPEELGRIQFDLTTKGDTIRLAVFVERPETLDLLRRHAEQLLADLRNAGFGHTSLDMGSWNQRDQAHEKATAQHPDSKTPAVFGEGLSPTAPASSETASLDGRLHLRL